MEVIISNRLVSIIIRCCNEEKHLGKLLTGIFEQTVPTIEVIIVDSGSIDRTLWVASRFPVIIRKINPNEFSFGRALNIGCSTASGEILVFASAHVYPTHRRWLEYLIAPFCDSRVGLTYGKQRGNEKSRYSEHQIFSKWFPERSVHVQKTPFCNNANAAVRRSLWEMIPFDEELTGLEDIDWGRRVLDKGYFLSYSAEAEVIHVHDEKYHEIFNRYYRESIVFYRLFPEQRFHIWDFFWLWLLNVTTDYVHAFREGRLSRNVAQIPLFRLMQFWGTYRGYAKRYQVSDVLRQRFYYPNGLSFQRHQEAMKPETEYIDYVKVNDGEKAERIY
jgi:rhamnosyltransferase